MRRPIVLSLVLAAMALAGAARACPAGDGRDASGPVATCDDARDSHARSDCPTESGVIDHLPDSFFVGGGGVGPQFVEGGGGEHVWVHGGSEASGSASAQASASASASVRVSVSVHGRGRGRW